MGQSTYVNTLADSSGSIIDEITSINEGDISSYLFWVELLDLQHTNCPTKDRIVVDECIA